MKKKYSPNFERDWGFYVSNVDNFTFCGTLIPKYTAIPSDSGKTAKDVFYDIDSKGKNSPCCEPELLNKVLLCKASVNFHIKQWAEGRADSTLPRHEFSGNGETLHWDVEIKRHKYFYWLPNIMKRWFNIMDKKIPVPVYRKSIVEQYGLPDWVVTAVENQK